MKVSVQFEVERDNGPALSREEIADYLDDNITEIWVDESRYAVKSVKLITAAKPVTK